DGGFPLTRRRQPQPAFGDRERAVGFCHGARAVGDGGRLEWEAGVSKVLELVASARSLGDVDAGRSAAEGRCDLELALARCGGQPGDAAVRGAGRLESLVQPRRHVEHAVVYAFHLVVNDRGGYVVL